MTAEKPQVDLIGVYWTFVWLDCSMIGCGQSSTVCQTRSYGKSCLPVLKRNRGTDNVQGQNNYCPSTFSRQYCFYYLWNIFGFENWGTSLRYTTDSAGEYSVRRQVYTGQVHVKNIWSQMDYKYVYPRIIMTHDNIVSFSIFLSIRSESYNGTHLEIAIFF